MIYLSIILNFVYAAWAVLYLAKKIDEQSARIDNLESSLKTDNDRIESLEADLSVIQDNKH